MSKPAGCVHVSPPIPESDGLWNVDVYDGAGRWRSQSRWVEKAHAQDEARLVRARIRRARARGQR